MTKGEVKEAVRIAEEFIAEITDYTDWLSEEGIRECRKKARTLMMMVDASRRTSLGKK